MARPEIPLKIKKNDLTSEGHLTRDSFEKVMRREGTKKGYSALEFTYTDVGTYLAGSKEDTPEGYYTGVMFCPLTLDKQTDKMKF